MQKHEPIKGLKIPHSLKIYSAPGNERCIPRNGNHRYAVFQDNSAKT